MTIDLHTPPENHAQDGPPENIREIGQRTWAGAEEVGDDETGDNETRDLGCIARILDRWHPADRQRMLRYLTDRFGS